MLPVFHILKTAVEKVIAQGERSFSNESGSCMYRHNGLCCVVGHMIPDDVYDPEMEVKRVAFLRDYLITPFQMEDLTLEQVSKVFEFLEEAQTVHDFHHPAEWEEGFHTIFESIKTWEDSQVFE